MAMKIGKIARRFLVPAFVRTIYYLIKYRAFVSPRAEVDLTSNLVLGRGAVVSAFTKLKATDGRVHIGANAMIGPGCFISSGTAGIRIGQDSMIAANTVMVANNHIYDRLDLPVNRQGLRSRGIELGKDVWIGANCSVLDGSNIGDQVIVNAGSVIGGNVTPRQIVAGNPAKPVFERR